MKIEEIIEHANAGTLDKLGLSLRGRQIGQNLQDGSFLAYSTSLKRIQEKHDPIQNPEPFIETYDEYKFRMKKLNDLKKNKLKGTLSWNSTLFGTKSSIDKHAKIKAEYDKLIESGKMLEFLQEQDKQLHASDIAKEDEELNTQKYNPQNKTI
jgi:hypothetical protein